VDHADPTARVGAVLAGKYKLVEEIGAGGMGSVFMAQQIEPVKRAVAVKVIKAGMDSREVLARFEAERQALAMMDHANIARVLDAGTTDGGRPFFVMELVKGTPITRYCDEHKLTPRQRLELFVPVCQAIQHAHQKGIIHRDIKPSNVLVAMYDDRAVPKVIDFGVAKAAGQSLTEKTLMTGFGQIVGTPEYMSPEQASLNNLDIDTRSDVYSLGVLLYELLTGTTPVDRKSLGKAALLEVLRVVREVEAPRPSAKLSTLGTLPSVAANRGTEPARLSRLMKGELDWLVLRALEKDRSRRYETANALSRDIQRYLADEVVEARPPSVGYRMRKFVRRHKGQVIAASLVMLALLAGLAGTTWGLFEARHQEHIAHGETEQKEKALRAEAERVKERDASLKREALRVKERDKANDELKHRLGVSAMVLANAAYDSRELKLAAERLAMVPIRQRGWEWRYLKRQLDGGIFTLHGHTGPVTSAAFSPDGTRIVTGGGHYDGPFEVKVWDARTGIYLFDLKGLPPKLHGFNTIPAAVSVAFSSDSKRILTAGSAKTARVYDATTGALHLELKEPTGAVECAAFSPDGTQIATAHDGGVVKVWDARTGKTRIDWRAHKYEVRRVAFSPDGTQVLTGGRDLSGGGDQAVKVWDARAGTLLLDAKGMMSQGSSVAFSPDGKRIVAGNGDGARVIDARTGGLLRELKGRPRVVPLVALTGSTGVKSVAFSPDGTRIVTGGGGPLGFGTGEARVWDAGTGAELLDLKGHTELVMSAAFSPDGTRILTGSWDGTVKVWDARTGTPRLELDGIKGSICAALSPDGKWIVTGGREFEKAGVATVRDARTGIPHFALEGFKGGARSVAISKDGTRIVTGGEDVATVWVARTGAPLVELKGLKESVYSVAFSPDGTRILTAGMRILPAGSTALNDEVKAKVWDATTGAVLLDLTKQEPLHCSFLAWQGLSVAFSPDGRRFVIGGVRKRTTTGYDQVKVRDARTGMVLVELKGIETLVLSVAFSPDGTRIATGSLSNTATVWDAHTGTALLELKGHTGNVNCVAFSPDGKRIVTGSGDRTVRVWDVRTATTLAELKGHAGAVTSVSFSADGSRLLTAAQGEVFVWDAPIPRPEVARILSDEELAYRQAHTQPNPARYRAGYLAARSARDDFAAAFYLNLVPPDQRKELLAQADAEAFAGLSKLADEYQGAGKPEKAVPLRIEILNVTKAKRGPEDPATIEAADRLAGLYRWMGRFKKAVPLWEEVVKYRKAKLGRNNPQTLATMRMLGWAYKEAGRLPEAIAVFEEEGARHPRFMAMLLDAYALAGAHAKVIARCRQELAAMPKSMPENWWPQADLLARLGRAYLAQKQWPLAEPPLRECVTLRAKNGPEDWTMFDAQSMLGGSLLGQKEYAEAEPLLLKGYEGLKQWKTSLEPQDAPRVPEALDRLIEFYTATNRPDEAKKWRAERVRYAKGPLPREKK
jgi:WD40 repeat protein/tetratricopeptide (TPR) repeat protein